MWYPPVICMRRTGSLFAVLILLIVGVCPALCFSSGADVPQKHGCCHEGKGGQSVPCKHSGSALTVAVIVQTQHAAQVALPEHAFNSTPLVPAAVMLPPAPRPLPPQPPKPTIVRRI